MLCSLFLSCSPFLSFLCESQRSLRVGVEVSLREDERNVNGCNYCLLSRKHFVLWKIYLCAALTFIIINQLSFYLISFISYYSVQYYTAPLSLVIRLGWLSSVHFLAL